MQQTLSGEHHLQFKVSDLLKQSVDVQRNYQIEDVFLPGLTRLDDDLALSGPINGALRLVNSDGDVLVMGTLVTRLAVPCTRCLTPVETDATVEIEEIFSPSIDISTGGKLDTDDVDPSNLIDERHILDLTEALRQSLILCQPTQVLCREDCQGLCPQCGINRNQETCDCQIETTDSRWNDLLALKDEL